MNLSVSGPSRHLIGVLRATPRGSNPTTSYCAITAGLMVPLAYCANSYPEPPGPPGLTTSDPSRFVGSFAGDFSILMVTVGPSGSA